MDVNFCSPGLTVNVKSSCVSCDSYEVNNLISSDVYKRQNGFLAERFIKPPVTLTFEFVCDIQINYLVIQSNVGSQKSVGLEIFTTTNLDINSVITQNTNSVAVGVIKNEEIGFVFYKHGYDIQQKIPVNNFVLRTFKSSRNLLTRELTIKIFKTHGSSIPALGRVEVWGRPSSKCQKTVTDKVYNHWKQHFSRAFPATSNAQVKQNNKTECNSRIDFPVDFKVPDEFVDPITCEIMVLPLILPCGKVIDKFTLEKHNETESHWGRSPSDPFTGIRFSDTNKPMIASDLKARIDKFLCDNSNEKVLLNVPRTVGRKVFSFPKLHHSVVQTGCENRMSYCGKSSFGNLQTGSKQEIQPQKHSVVSKNIKFSPYIQNRVSTTLSHEEMSERSLDNLVKTTLSSLPSVFQTSLKENITNKCVICRNNTNLFQMPCIHVVCRPCLVDMVNKKQLKCVDCDIVFKPSDAKRIHI